MTTASKSVGPNALRTGVDLVEEAGSGQVLSGRKRGRETRTKIAEKLKVYEPGSLVGINATRVQFMNYSFADECLGVLAQELYAGSPSGVFPALVADFEAQEDVLEEIQVSLERRKLALLCLDEAGEHREATVLGELPEYLWHTLRAVQPADTNEMLAEKLNIKVTTCNNRTDRLAKLRLLRKQRRSGELGYKQFEFFPVVFTEALRPNSLIR